MRELEELGFSENEARIYAANLELGPSTVADIARKAGVNRTTGYNILEVLVAKRMA
ncbi:TrmB family transcriptional regulator, partial [Candidatus Berkelbacteria bacterium]|nr:TrmB family transcriptional regulator [Candidatus Berkelbacteria bacterium]